MASSSSRRKKPGKDPRWPYAWEVIPDALEEARRMFGLRRKVRVYHRAFKRMEGSYDGLNEYGEHMIAIAVDLRSDYASRTLWHELWHAAQAERMGYAEFMDTYETQRMTNGVSWNEVYKGSGSALRAYRAMPLEEEAGKRRSGIRSCASAETDAISTWIIE